MLRKWKLLAPLVMTAAGALAAGIAVLLQNREQPETADSSAPARAEKEERRVTGCYSFISGFQDAKTVELCIDFDPKKFGFSILEEDFLRDTGDSHVAVLCGEEFELQIEYAAYYGGEDFAAHCAGLKERYPEVHPCRCGGQDAVWVLDGGDVLIHLPIPGDSSSYILITVRKTADYDDAPETLPAYAPLKELLAGIRFLYP